MRNAILQRTSRRTFEKKHLTRQELADIQRLVQKYNQLGGLHIQLVEDGSLGFHALRKSYGLFRNVRSVLLMKGREDEKFLAEKLGYYGERMVLDLTDMGYGTCWVGGTFDKEVFSVPEGERLVCVIPVGRVPGMTLKERAIHRMSGKRLPIEQRLTADTEELPEWLREGMEAVRLAPSAVNSQKPRFLYEKGTLTASVEGNYAMDPIDLGIAKCHFAEAADGTFGWGDGGVFCKNPA